MHRLRVVAGQLHRTSCSLRALLAQRHLEGDLGAGDRMGFVGFDAGEQLD